MSSYGRSRAGAIAAVEEMGHRLEIGSSHLGLCARCSERVIRRVGEDWLATGYGLLTCDGPLPTLAELERERNTWP
jgi:hypothetical protein